jgi:hypothetical protein
MSFTSEERRDRMNISEIPGRNREVQEHPLKHVIMVNSADSNRYARGSTRCAAPFEFAVRRMVKIFRLFTLESQLTFDLKDIIIC